MQAGWTPPIADDGAMLLSCSCNDKYLMPLPGEVSLGIPLTYHSEHKPVRSSPKTQTS